MSSNEMEKPQHEQCKCFDTVLGQVQAKMDIPIDAADIEVDWQNKLWCLSEKDMSPVSMKIEASYRAAKRGGGIAKNTTRKSVSVFPSYCPFCGRKYGRD